MQERADAAALLGLGEGGVGLLGEPIELRLALGEALLPRAQLRGDALVLLLRGVELALRLSRGGLGRRLLGLELLLEVGDLLLKLGVLVLQLLDPGRARRVDVVLVALQHRDPDRQPDRRRPAARP